MNRKSLFWHLYPAFLILSLFAVLFVAFQLYSAFRNFVIEDGKNDLKQIAKVIEHAASEGELNANFLANHINTSELHVRIFNADGSLLLATPEQNVYSEDSLFQGTQIENVLAVGSVSVLSVSGEKYLHYLSELQINQKKALMHVSRSFTYIDNLLTPYRFQVIFSSFILFLLIAIVSWFYTRSLVRPINMMQVKTKSMSSGDFSEKIPIQSLQIHEFRQLATSINKMASQIFKRLRTITRQRNEKEAIFSSLTQGVIAVNDKGVVFSLNRAAAEILDYQVEDYKGKSLPVVVRIPELEEFIRQSYYIESVQEIELKLMHKEPVQHLLVRTSPLMNENKVQDGVVVTISDITRLKNLENVRKDFVANVSHELKTPLTSIQGYSETLVEAENLTAEQTKQFLSKIHKHSTGLSQMVDELLNLAKYEEGSEGAKQRVSANTLVSEVMMFHEEKAKKKNISLNFEKLEVDVVTLANEGLLKQAISNLVHNAIKYSPEGCKVLVKVTCEKDQCVFHVIDDGDGIEPQHLSRIFERFYRIDPARNEKTGGSGLGLAIVKHIAKSHSGHIEVDSVLGQGSHFKLSLPIVS